MRTTLTLDDDLAGRLKELARCSDRNFKDVVNDVIRKGLSLGDPQPSDQTRFVVRAKPCGFRAGVDPAKLTQLCDDLEIEDLRGETGFGVHEP